MAKKKIEPPKTVTKLLVVGKKKKFVTVPAEGAEAAFDRVLSEMAK